MASTYNINYTLKDVLTKVLIRRLLMTVQRGVM